MKIHGSPHVSRWITAVLLIAGMQLGLLPAAEAASRKVVIEFGGNSSEVDDESGDAWTATSGSGSGNCSNDTTAVGSPVILACGLTFAGNGNAAEIPVKLGFEVRIGAILYDRIFISRYGMVTFGNDSTSGVTGELTNPPASLAALGSEITNGGSVTRPFVAVLFANLNVPQVTEEFNYTVGAGGTSFFRGVADPIGGTVSDPYKFSDANPALAVNWVSGEDNNIRVQLVIYKDGDEGDFYLNLRYGPNDSTSYDIASVGSTIPGVAGFSLGATTLSLASPVPNPDGHFYSFRNGELDTGTAPADGDGDGVPDSTDNCPLIANASQANNDNDAFGDACDGDDDNDTVADGTDNCPLIANTSQTNSDSDALGNACDGDDDNDSVADTADNCPIVANASQADADGDGVGDACDSTPNPVANRCQVDSDKDVDALDILAIIKAAGRRASGPTDPRDSDGNGMVTLKDAAQCTQKCTRWLCLVK